MTMINNRLIGYSLFVILIICCSPFKFGNAEEIVTSSTTSTTTSQYSGGLWIGNSNQVALVGYNASFIISEFSVKNYNYSYFLSVPEINWNYFSYYNASTKGAIQCKIMRSRPDGTNVEFIANSVYLNLSSNYYLNQMTVCKFAIDVDNNYLYYASKDQVIRSLLNGGDPVAFKTLSAGYNIIGVQLDTVYKHIVFSYLTTSGYAYIEGVAISNNQSYVYSKYISSLVYDFAVYNESLAFVTPYSYYYTYVYYYPNVITSYYSTSITWGYSTFSVSVDQTNGIFYAASYSYHTLTSWNTTSSSPLPITKTLSYYGTIRFISVQTSYCSGDCFGRGECISSSSSPSPSTFSCQCTQNYYSANCSVYCVDSYCHNGGHCNSDGFCDCPTDYYGDYCTCSFDICNKNGNCSSSGLCQCNTYYSGQYCQSPIINPTTPRTFEATAVVNSVKSSFYYSYSSQVIVIKYDDDYSVMYDYIAGYEYNYTSTSCLKSELSVAVLLPLQPTSTSHLIYWNGTNSDMNCELNSISIWVDTLPAPTSTLFMQQSCLSSTGYVPLFYADESVSTTTISFNTQSFNFNPPSSIFSVPSICSN